MQYKLHLNLQQRATLKAAIVFWENKEVKDKVAEFFKSCYELEIWEAQRKWGEFTKAVINEFNKDLLPQELEVELIHIIKMIGKTMFNWYYYIKYEYGIEEQPINWIDKIHWTPYGTVDEVKTFKSYWLENVNFNITELYDFACIYVIEDHINDLWNRIPSYIQKHYHDNTLQHFDRHMLMYWKCCRDKDLPNLMRYFELAAEDFNRRDMLEFNLIYDLTRSLEENMLRLSAYQGLFSAVKYFWWKLTEEKRDESVVKCARIALFCCHYHQQDNAQIEVYKISQYVEICIFLMNQMTKSHKKAFFNEKLRERNLDIDDIYKIDVRDGILWMLLSGWPWQELFMPVFKDMLRLLDGDSTMACKFLDSITKKMSEDYLPNYPKVVSKYRNLLREVWLLIPGIIKQKLVKEDDMYDFIGDLLNLGDLDSLKLILNDPEIATVRNQYIDFGLKSYEQLILDDKYDILDQFNREILKTEEEIKRLKQNIDINDILLINGDFHLTDKLLDWKCSTSEEKQSVKKSIEYEMILNVSIGEYDFELLNKFSDWIFETEDKKKNGKNRVKSGIYPMMWICEIWQNNKTNIHEAKDKSFQLLRWLLESEEEIAHFKRELFVNLERDQELMDYLAELNREGIMKNLLSWCLLPDDEIRRIEQIVSQ